MIFWPKNSFYFSSITTHHWHYYKTNLSKTGNNTKLEMKKLLILRTKKGNFSCHIEYYIAILYSNWRDHDGFTFWPSNNQHMVEPESIFVTNLDDHIKLETFCQWYLSIYQTWFDWICFNCTESLSW